MDDALHSREADAVAGELGFRMQPLEWLEQTAGASGIKASSIVAYEEYMNTASFFDTKLNPCLGMPRRVLP